jgi:hypothetical protein
MKWILVYLFWTGTEMNMTQVDSYDDMSKCFFERETLAVDLDSVDGYFPVNHQAICVRVE